MLSSLSLLPLSRGELDSGISQAITKLVAEGLGEEEALLKLSAAFDDWLDGEETNTAFPRNLVEIINAASWAERAMLPPAQTYAAIIRKLTAKFSRSRREAASVVSRLPLILTLASDGASSARIAGLIGQSAGKGTIGWRGVRSVLDCFAETKSSLDDDDVAGLLERDRTEAAEKFGDADVTTIVAILSEQATAFGLDAELSRALNRLFAARDETPFIPYLQILLYMAVVDEFFDHPPEYIYTFRPRGSVSNRIFGMFPPSLAPGGNPMLNNFKAVDRLTYDWAESREDTRYQAEDLVTVVCGMSSLSYPARRYLAATIRRGILRFIEIQSPIEISIPNQSGTERVVRCIEKVAEGPTYTRGVLEQRVTDFMSSVIHADPKWRSRGLGDPVNASNSSSRKLGDCDFQNADGRECHAIEAHAGRLTDVYVNEHLRTLRLNLPARLEEWSAISDLDFWNLQITFVVHEDARSYSECFFPTDVSGGMRVMTFSDMLESIVSQIAEDPDETLSLFNRWVVAQLNSANTPHAVRKLAAELLTGQTFDFTEVRNNC